ncbi:hypothetical protein [Lentimicrobium sp. S6]|uniref:hypothetical protein n=1 Tax=Lentimicrobium sp. S6 TaxID=2735872 RepID=UPI0015575042|nr:hypothetical protein [Lentimicrobium sp. S6]NPD48016.1 hypothetical protein [Lentimicrobium sp. S6]
MVDLTKIRSGPGGGKNPGFALFLASILIFWGFIIYKKFVDDKEEENKPISKKPETTIVEEVNSEEIENEEK